MRLSASTIMSRALAHAYLLLYRRRVAVRPLQGEHADAATRLLTEQFCRREPLCRHLAMPVDELLPFFREQVDKAARDDLGLVAVDKSGAVIGIVTMEDHCAPYVPTPALLTPALHVIGGLLEQLNLPAAFEPKGPGEVFHCAIAAVRPGRQIAPVLTVLIAGIWRHMIRKGYQRGYAKVTNPRVLDNMRKAERIARRGIFVFTTERTEADFAPDRFAPLTKFRVALVTWRLNF
jgi:hypothetical protein